MKRFERIVEVDKDSGVVTSCILVHTDDNGILLDPPLLLLPGSQAYADAITEINAEGCAACCAPAISSYTGDTLAPSHPFNVISVQNNTCCTVLVTTDFGSFHVPKQTAVCPQPFCADSVAATIEFLGDPNPNCDLADVHIILQKTQ